MAGKSGFGDPSKLSEDKFSARAKRSVLRGDDSNTYACGGAVVKKMAKGGSVDGVAIKGKTKGKIV